MKPISVLLETKDVRRSVKLQGTESPGVAAVGGARRRPSLQTQARAATSRWKGWLPAAPAGNGLLFLLGLLTETR